MNVLIIDDRIQGDWLTEKHRPAAILSGVLGHLELSFSCRVNGVNWPSLNEAPRIEFITSSPQKNVSDYNLAAIDVVLMDINLGASDDTSGIEEANKIAVCIPKHRILLVSRIVGPLIGRPIAGYESSHKNSSPRIAEWLKERINAPSRKIVGSSIIDKHLNYRTPIDNAFHGWPLGIAPGEQCPIETFRNDLKAVGVCDCPELDVLAGDPDDKIMGCRAVFRSDVAADFLKTYYPANGSDKTWLLLVGKLNIAKAMLPASLMAARVKLRDWAFPRADSNDDADLCQLILRSAWSKVKDQTLEFSPDFPSWVHGSLGSGKDLKHSLPFTSYLDFFDDDYLPNAGSAKLSWKVYGFKKNVQIRPFPYFLVVECSGKEFDSLDVFETAASRLFRHLRLYCHVLTSATCGREGVLVLELLPSLPKPRRIASSQVTYDGIALDFKAAHNSGVASTYVFVLDSAS